MTCPLGNKKNTNKRVNKTPFTNGAAFLHPIPPALLTEKTPLLELVQLIVNLIKVHYQKLY